VTREEIENVRDNCMDHLDDIFRTVVHTPEEKVELADRFEMEATYHEIACRHLMTLPRRESNLQGDEALRFVVLTLEHYSIDHPRLAKHLEPAIRSIRILLPEGGAA